MPYTFYRRSRISENSFFGIAFPPVPQMGIGGDVD